MTPLEAHIVRCKAGDLSSFGPLYEAFVRKIYDFVFYRVADREAAEDIVSDVFHRALSKVRGFHGSSEAEFAAWLFSIARNAVTDKWRSRPNEAVNLESVEGVVGTGEDFAAAEDRRRTLRAAFEWLEKLPKDQRDVVMMRVWDDLPYAQIASVTGRSEDSCKQVVSRALRQLQANVPLAVALAVISLFSR